MVTCTEKALHNRPIEHSCEQQLGALELPMPSAEEDCLDVLRQLVHAPLRELHAGCICCSSKYCTRGPLRVIRGKEGKDPVSDNTLAPALG